MVKKVDPFSHREDEDWAMSKTRGIMAVPTFVINQDKLVGAQPYETLEKFMAANGVRKTDRSNI